MCVCNISIYKNTNTLTYIHTYIYTDACFHGYAETCVETLA